jgi:hypothetical protein
VLYLVAFNFFENSSLCIPVFASSQQSDAQQSSMSHSHIVKHAQRGSRQVHHNRERFNPYKYKDDDQKLHSSILDTMTSMCCKRCCDIIQWKVDFGKYTHLERPRKCNGCGEKSVAIAYHHICQICAKKAMVCAKCQHPPKFDLKPDGTAQELPNSGDSDSQCSEEETAAGKGPRCPSTILQYAFVNELDSDEEFQPLRGLDIRRLKQYKRRVQAMQEREERNNLRERERRTILRKQKKALGEDVDSAAMGLDSDEEI